MSNPFYNMKFGICHLSIVPCRKEPADSSEMVTQLLFGDLIKVYEEKKGSWRRIKIANDNYECWIDCKQFVYLEKEEFDDLLKKNSLCCTEFLHPITKTPLNSLTPIVLGSSLPNFKKGEVTFSTLSYKYEGTTSLNNNNLNKRDIVTEFAYMYLNAPYLWGGKSPLGIDCSGLTQMVYKIANIQLPRDAYQQAEIGQTLSFVEESEAGDLAFFDNEEGHIIHVGIILSDSKIIHASGYVRIDKIDHQGIFNVDTGRYTHRLRLIKKIV